jgi:hypothetical protein
VSCVASLITEAYRSQQQELHDGGLYGYASRHYAPLVTQIIKNLEVTHLLDYGCGSKLSLYNSIQVDRKLVYQAYDPAVPDYAGEPVPAQMVACIDVLEHIEPEFLEAVLDDLCRLTEVVLFCTIHTGPAKKTLADGRNAHLTQQPMSWWLPKLWDRFDLQSVQVTGEHNFYVIGYANKRIELANGGKAGAR